MPNIERSLGEEIFKNNINIIENVICHGFEDVVNSYMDELNEKNELPFVCNPFKKYDASNSQLGRPIEIDGLADSLDNTRLLVTEAKFKNENISIEVLNHLKESTSIFNGKYKEIYYYLFSKTSFTNELSTMNSKYVKLFTLDDMIK